MFCVEYIWLGNKNELRSKTKVIKCDSIENIQLDDWNYDGSSTGQASCNSSEVIIRPRTVVKDPFRQNGALVMCDTFLPNGDPHPDNTRVYAEKVFQDSYKYEPWFGIEQEYFLFDPKTGKPIGFPNSGFPNPQGQYYCSVGAENAFGRQIVEEHLQACIESGIGITGVNFEVCCGQLEFQIKETGILAGDHLWISRYLLERIAEKYGLTVCYDPKPIKGDWNGSGCHTNFSTKEMRETGGLLIIENALEKLSNKHLEHINVYGIDNNQRLTGHHETSSMTNFTIGYGNRGASIRIPTQVIKEGKGYFEDRRPAANMDPWLVTAKIYETVVL